MKKINRQEKSNKGSPISRLQSPLDCIMTFLSPFSNYPITLFKDETDRTKGVNLFQDDSGSSIFDIHYSLFNILFLF